MLLTSEHISEVRAETTDSSGTTEALRHILILQERREIGHDEAQEIGMSLIEFYQLLADGTDDDTTD